MTYREHLPPPRWRGLAECLWTSAPPSASEVVEVLPDGCMDLVWSGAELLVAGPDTAPHPFTRAPGLTATGLRFHPGMLPALLGVPASALRDTRVPLEALHPVVARRAYAALSGGAAPPAVLAGIAALLPGEAPGPDLRAATRWLSRGASAERTADALGWTTRTLHRRSVSAFGYGPAMLRRVLRFRRAVALLGTGLPPADVAARTGYADQPHLSREVRALGGTTPAGVAAGVAAPEPTRSDGQPEAAGNVANRSTPVPSGSWTTA